MKKTYEDIMEDLKDPAFHFIRPGMAVRVNKPEPQELSAKMLYALAKVFGSVEIISDESLEEVDVDKFLETAYAVPLARTSGQYRDFVIESKVETRLSICVRVTAVSLLGVF